MENFNLHKQKFYGLLITVIGLISMFLPWRSPKIKINLPGHNGFHKWGLLALVGISIVILASLLGDKSKAYQGQMKQIAMGGFALILIAAVLVFIDNIIGSRNFGVPGDADIIKNNQLFRPGTGLFLCMFAGVAGFSWVAGLIKLKEQSVAGTITNSKT